MSATGKVSGAAYTIELADPAAHRELLSTCRGTQHAQALLLLLGPRNYSSARTATADAEAFFGNPATNFNDFAGVVKAHIRHWNRWPTYGKGHQPFSLDPSSPGRRARDWWMGLIRRDYPVGDPQLLAWHRVWLLRRAFALAEPDDLPELLEWILANPSARRLDGNLHERLAALVRHRSLPGERLLAATEPEGVQAELLRDWDSPWCDLRSRVPARTTREQAQSACSAMFLDPDREPERTLATAAARRAVADAFQRGRMNLHRGGWFSPIVDLAVLTQADVAELAAVPCTGLSRDELPLQSAQHVALGIVPLTETEATRHLPCPEPEHRVQLVLNPFVTAEAAAMAIDIELEDLNAEEDSHVEVWWDCLMAVRGWLPATVLEPAMQRLSERMLDDEAQFAKWLPMLGVFASRPEGLVAMTPEQVAVFDALVAARLDGESVVPWSINGGPWDHQLPGNRYLALMSVPVLRQVALVTGADRGVILDPGVASALPAMPADIRVLAARHGDEAKLQHLLRDPDPRVRQHVARNRRASAATLERLLEDPDPTVRSQVARNARVTSSHLVRMSTDPDRRVSGAAARVVLGRLTSA